MIKLKSILKEVFNEVRRGSAGTYEYIMEFDGEEILALSRDTDSIEVIADIQYSIDPGSKGSWDEPPEGASVEIEGHEVRENIMITSEDGTQREVDMKFLHPRQRQRIYDLAEKKIDKNESEIETNILEGES